MQTLLDIVLNFGGLVITVVLFLFLYIFIHKI